MNIRKITLMGALMSLLLVQEQLLTFLPNIQFSTLLILIFVSHFSFKQSLTLIFVYVVLDSLWMGAINPFYMVPMFVGWSVIPVAYHTLLRRTQNPRVLAFFGLVMASLYGFVFMPFAVFQTGVSMSVYLVADIPFQILMALSNFFTILWLYEPLNARFAGALQGYDLTLHLEALR